MHECLVEPMEIFKLCRARGSISAYLPRHRFTVLGYILVASVCLFVFSISDVCENGGFSFADCKLAALL